MCSVDMQPFTSAQVSVGVDEKLPVLMSNVAAPTCGKHRDMIFNCSMLYDSSRIDWWCPKHKSFLML